MTSLLQRIARRRATDASKRIVEDLRAANSQLADTNREFEAHLVKADRPIGDHRVHTAHFTRPEPADHWSDWTGDWHWPVYPDLGHAKAPEPPSDKRLKLLEEKMTLIETQLNQIQDHDIELLERTAMLNTGVPVAAVNKLARDVQLLSDQLTRALTVFRAQTDRIRRLVLDDDADIDDMDDD